MLEYEKIDVSEGIVTDKKSLSKECMLCHYWYFKDDHMFVINVTMFQWLFMN